MDEAAVMAKEPFLGVLGGMGPLAATDFLVKLVEETHAARDQDNVPVLLWGDCRTPDRTDFLLGRGPDPEPYLVRGARGLQAMGAEALVITCNTAHAFADIVADQISIPLLHIADAVADEALATGARRIALMSTRGTVVARAYERRFADRGLALIVPDDAMQDEVDQGIALVKGGAVANARARFDAVFDRMIEAGADRVALACTEIPVALTPAPARALDPTRALARRCVRWWIERQTVAAHAAATA